MYKNLLRDKKFWFWVIGTTIGLSSGIIAALLSTYTLEYLSLLGAICGLFLGFAQGLFLAKLFNQRKFAITNHILVKWILATTFGMSIGGGITSLLGRFISNRSVILTLGILLAIIPLSFAQGFVMEWQAKKIYRWLLANLLGVLSSGAVGVFVYFLSSSIVVGLTGGGFAALIVLLTVTTLSISLSTGFVYGGITGLFLLRLLNDSQV
jgi:hypothetical protein